MAKTIVLPIRVTAEQLAEIDARAGGKRKRSAYVRERLFGDNAETRPREREIAEYAAGEPAMQAPVSDPEPAAAPKEELLIPPVGHPDAYGWHYRWNPRTASVGTLQFAKAGGEWREMDLVGVELEPQGNGGLRLRFSDRSLIRRVEREA